MLSGNLSIEKRVKLTKAVFGSRLFALSIKRKVAKATVATTNGAQAQINVEIVLINSDLKRFLNSLARIF